MEPLVTQTPRKARLSVLLEGISRIEAANDRDIHGLSLDSRRTRPGDLFLACSGLIRNGHEFIEHAIRAGAVAVVFETAPSDDQESLELHNSSIKTTNVPLIGVAGLRQQVGIIASRFYDHPSHDLFVIGITGTNGKTTCCNFIAEALTTPEHACGVIGTLGYGVYGSLQPGKHTTPDAITLQSLLADMRRRGVKTVVMEVSSHGLDQGRVTGTSFDAAVFTNLSHDHLDYHGDLSAYALAKQQLFEMPQLKFAVINANDEYGRRLIEVLPTGVVTMLYSIIVAQTGNDDGTSRHLRLPGITGTIIRMDNSGLEMQVTTPRGGARIQSPVLGRFNASNLLATLAMLLLTDMPLDKAVRKLKAIHMVPGRMEHFRGNRHQPLVVVDYAHSPDALKQVLQTLREHCRGNLWCVFGCGGDRDRAKRPLMGAIAEDYADHVVITDDNPRFESAGQIITDILAGMQAQDAVTVMHDRGEAITHAVRQATADDIVLIAGKGHEEYQLVGDQRISFSDRCQVDHLLKEVA